MKLEARIRRAVELELAKRPSSLGSWEKVLGRARRARRGRLGLSAMAAAALAVSAVYVVAELSDDPRRPAPLPVVTQPGSPTPSPSRSASARPVAGIPDTIVALDHGDFGVHGDERIVVIENGRVSRVLAEGTTGAEPTSIGPGIALTPDGRNLYFPQGTSGSSCEVRRIMTVPVAGGTPRAVVQGTAVAISPNGRMLAYAAMGKTKPDCDRPDLVIRDLRTGAERRWRWAAEDPNDPYQQRGAQRLAWAPDNRHLAFERNVGDPLDQVWVLDTTQGTTLLDATKITPDRKSWSSPTYVADGLAVIEGLRSIHDPEGSSGKVIVVDPSDGRLLRTMSGEVDGVVTIEAGSRGEYLVLATVDGLFRLGEGGLLRVANGSYYGAFW